MSAKNLTDQQALDNARTLVDNLRTIRRDMLRRLDDFTLYVEMIAEDVEKAQQGAEDARNMRVYSATNFIRRTMEKVDDITNMPTGGTDAMHVREFRHNAYEALSGEALELPFRLTRAGGHEG
ncbi:hypothetical protein [Terracoccus sp. 273MFTsu3.1]|uniref:hypothetical protein n=1 Tax=Terracoccus sp. 273MFTsu3.1 TaxID=1172188 RepID=UPI00035DCC1F|nr:hypothetical protein [Terracoccus sp. 273MFTsu3.1]